MLCLLIVCRPWLLFSGDILFGGRGGYSAIELVMMLRILLEKALEWRRPLIILKVDVAKAFDTLRHSAILKWIQKINMPIRQKFALLRELFGVKFVRLKGPGIMTRLVRLIKGMRQGTVEAGLIFALVVGGILGDLDAKWKEEGIGFRLGSFDGDHDVFESFMEQFFGHFLFVDVQDIETRVFAFLDDLLLTCSSINQAQRMLDDISAALAEAGMTLAHKPCACGPKCRCKCQWLMDKHSCDSGVVGELKLYGIPVRQVTEMIVLGSVIHNGAAEMPAITHRISAGWRCFAKWRHILTCKANLGDRLKFWQKTVFRSLAWGIQTLRTCESQYEKLACVQRLMVRCMLGLKRKPIVDQEGTKIGMEPWLDYQKRSLRRAKEEIEACGLNMHNLLLMEKRRWAGHIARMGWEGKEPHLLKAVVGWRNLWWWDQQKFYNLFTTQTIRHAFPFKPMRWEEHFPLDWLNGFQPEVADFP
jgi:hypothetical protein